MSLNLVQDDTVESIRPQLPKNFHHLTVVEVRKETRDAVSILLEVPHHLESEFQFSAGQFLTLEHEHDGELLRRPYSLCVAPGTGEWRFCCKRIHGGRVSTFLNEELVAGDQLAVMIPNGKFGCDTQSNTQHQYVGLAGGSGITPIMSIIQTVLQQEPASNFTLFYGNRTSPDIIFRELLLDLKNRFLSRLQVVHILSDEQTDIAGFHGLLDEKMVETLLPQLVDPARIDGFFICGPGPMMDGAKKALNTLDVDPSVIHMESFGQKTVHASGIAPEPTVSSNITATIKAGGSSIGIAVNAGQSILDAALAAGLDLPYACKGGVCCTCKAKLVNGDVSMAVNYGLEADEIERGFILTCQAIPTTENLLVDYDV